MYCTQADILKRIKADNISGFASDEENPETLDTELINAAIFDADTIINDHIKSKYVTPLLPVPDRIKLTSIHLAVYNIYSVNFDNETPANVQERKDSAIDYLAELKNSECSLDCPLKVKSRFISRSNKSSLDKKYSTDILSQI